MTIICAWCKLVMQVGGALVSHGICSKCEAKHFSPEPIKAVA